MNAAQASSSVRLLEARNMTINLFRMDKARKPGIQFLPGGWRPTKCATAMT